MFEAQRIKAAIILKKDEYNNKSSRRLYENKFTPFRISIGFCGKW